MPKPPAIFAPTWLDRVISYVAPTWGAHRMEKHSCSKGAAMAAVAKANPEAHKKWIAASNAARK